MEAEGSNINWEKIPFSLKVMRNSTRLTKGKRTSSLIAEKYESLDIIAKLLPEYEESEELGVGPNATWAGVKKVEDDNAYLEACAYHS